MAGPAESSVVSAAVGLEAVLDQAPRRLSRGTRRVTAFEIFMSYLSSGGSVKIQILPGGRISFQVNDEDEVSLRRIIVEASIFGMGMHRPSLERALKPLFTLSQDQYQQGRGERLFQDVLPGMRESCRQQRTETVKMTDVISDSGEMEQGKASAASYFPVEDLIAIVTCSICVEVLHDAVTASPCLHTYCGGCLSDWIYSSTRAPILRCPNCREPIRSVTHDHSARKVAEMVLTQLSTANKKTEDEKKVLDGKNKFKELRITNISITSEAIPSRCWRNIRRRRRRRPHFHPYARPSATDGTSSVLDG